jgi:hypothetical protein
VDAVNDTGLIFNRNGVFDTFTGYEVGAASIYANQLMIGDANSTGDVFQIDASTDDTDANSPVESSFTPMRFSAGKPDSYKLWEKMYLSISRDDTSVSQIFRVDYTLPDISTVTTSFNVEIATGSSITNQYVNFATDRPLQSKYIDLRVYEITSGKRYYINRMRLYGTILPPE